MTKKRKRNKQKLNSQPKVELRLENPQDVKTTHKPLPSRWSKYHSLIFSFFNILGYLVAFVSFYLAINHSIYVPETYSISSKNPLYTPFIFKNNSYLPLDDIEIKFVINRLLGYGTYNYHWEVTNSTPMPYHINKIKPYGEHTAEFNFQRLLAMK